MKCATDRRGFITVEASVILPVFLLMLMALGYYIKLFGIIENVSFSMMDEAEKAASKAYITEAAPMFRKNTADRIERDSPEISNLKISNARYLYSDGNLDDLISVTAEYRVDIGLSQGMGHTVDLISKVKCRGFTGTVNSGEVMGFDEMEKEGVWEPVWIFPLDGEKYHREDCRYVSVNAREMVLTSKLKKEYSPCILCDAGDVPAGGFVYCFMKEGTAYHKGDCRLVERYVIEINRGEAEEKGYSPCSKCGGV